MSKLDYDRVALILVEAVFFGEKPTAKRWGVSEKTVQRYRERMNNDPELSALVQLKKETFESEWASEIPSAIRAGIRFLAEAAQVADRKKPETIHAVAGAVKILAEIGLAKEIIDVRLGRYDRPGREEGGQMAPLLISQESDGDNLDSEPGATN